MKKILFTLFVTFATISSSSAQQYHTEKSIPFDEPDYGWNKILQLKNGNTFFFHAENKEGIEIVIYDKSRKQIAKKTLEGKLWDAGKLSATKILGLYEISGEPVLFMAQSDGREPTLYRIRINPANGSVIKEEELGRLPKVSIFAGYAVAFGHVDPNDIIIEKDPASDYYAVIYFNGFAHETNERIKVCHYDGNHKMINEAYYKSPGDAFKYLRYIGSLVDRNHVYITTFAYNGRSGGDEANRVIVSRLDEGATTFKHKLLAFSEDFDNTKSIMLFNHNNNKIQLLTQSLDGKDNPILSNTTKNYYSTLVAYIDPQTLEVTNLKPVAGNKVAAYAHEHIDDRYDFHGVPQLMVINKDNSTTIMMEELTHETTMNSKGAVVSQKTLLGPIGISELSDTGAEVNGYTINKKQLADGIIPTMYLADRAKGIFRPAVTMNLFKGKGNVNQFMSYDYINAPKGRYVIFNDLPSNYAKDEDEKKRKTMSTVSGSNTICFKLNDGAIDKFYLFGDPEDKESNFCYIEVSDYNKDINTYATLIVERDGRDKQARIAWVTFE